MREIKIKINKVKKEVKTARGTPSLPPLDVGLGELTEITTLASSPDNRQSSENGSFSCPRKCSMLHRSVCPACACKPAALGVDRSAALPGGRGHVPRLGELAIDLAGALV